MAARKRKSLKRFGGKGTTSEQREYKSTLYLDENVCETAAIVAVLQQAQFPFRRHLEFFERGVEDEVWLQLPGLMGWLVLNKDNLLRIAFASSFFFSSRRRHTRWPNF